MLLPGREITSLQSGTYLLTLPSRQVIAFNRERCSAILIDGDAEHASEVLRSPDVSAPSSLRTSLKQHGFFDPPTPPSEPALNPIPLARQETLTLYLLVSQHCNLNCIYCFGRAYASQTRMPAETASRVIDFYRAAIPKESRFRVVLFGGEPLTNLDILTQVLPRYTGGGDSRNYVTPSFLMTTNLTLLTPEIAKLLGRHQVGVLCDFDPHRAHHDAQRPYALSGEGSWQDVMASLRMLRDRGIPFHVRTTVTKMIQDRCPDIVQATLELGTATCGVCPVIPFDSKGETIHTNLGVDLGRYSRSLLEIAQRFPDDLERIWPFNDSLERLHRGGGCFACPAPLGGMRAVDAHGNIYPCQYLVGDRKLCMGAIVDGAQEDMAPLQRFLAQTVADRPSGCHDCPWLYLCAGGCPAYRHHATGRSARSYVTRLACAISKTVYPVLLENLARPPRRPRD